MPNVTRRALAVLRLLPFALPTLGAAQTPQAVKSSGTADMNYADQHAIPVGDAEGHVLMTTQAKGLNRNTGQDAYMDGATVTSTELADLTQGSGPHEGYIVFAKGADSTLSRWNGTVKTVLSPEQTPTTTFQGTWTMVRGTGRYAGASGNGRYRGKVTSEKGYTVEWDGSLTVKQKAATE